MGFKKVVLIIAIIVGLASYWLYAPLPPGYSSESRKQFQFMIIGLKLIDVASKVGSFLGFGTYVEVYRNIGTKIMKDYRPKFDIEGVTTSDTVFDGIPVRIYSPDISQDETLPGITYFHGGGFTYGSIDTVDPIVKRLCKDTRSVVVSVEYRLAPEFPFPAVIDDCAAATRHFLSNAAKYNVDARRIAVAGDSAGGNLAATVSLKLRDERFPIPIKVQVLIYPVTQSLDFDLPSMVQNRQGPLVVDGMMSFSTAMYADGNENHLADYGANRHVTRSFREQIAKTFLNLDRLPKEYLEGYERPSYPKGDEKIWNAVKDKLLNPYHSPLTAESLENLPEAFVLTAHYDPLRDEGHLYAMRLQEANNKVTLFKSENGFHGVVSFVESFPEVEPIFAEITKFIREKL